ncbi:MAG: hypothetical protein A2341_08550 [Deltaproteobacteria bacterium RIFOXYB12_FULL_58_9]|nr:MAG: hypothetical protein A2341_08550 [Deltaproteobacteria bacterium RIFOXYB12_FULL_58_9]
MTKAGNIGRGLPPPQVHSLQQKEAQKTKQQAQQTKISQSDQARLAQQAGFSAQQKKKGLNIGDSSKTPIPLPDDDVDPDSWTADMLEGAQSDLAMASTQLEDISKTKDAEMGSTLVGSSFMPNEDGLADLQDLADRPPPQPMPLEEVTTSVERLFAIKLDDEVSVGHRILVAGLVAAGEASAVDFAGGKINEQKLAAGIQKVTERSNQSVGEAQKNIKGIDRELNVQRTFVFRR